VSKLEIKKHLQNLVKTLDLDVFYTGIKETGKENYTLIKKYIKETLISGGLLTLITSLTGHLPYLEIFEDRRDFLIFSYESVIHWHQLNTIGKVPRGIAVTLNPYWFPISYLLGEGVQQYTHSMKVYIAQHALKNSPYYMLLSLIGSLTKEKIRKYIKRGG
jgi:hypothetical protein